MARITNKKIKQYISENYGGYIEYDGVKIERNVDGYDIDVKIISYGRKITWFQGNERDDFFEMFKTHTDWQLGM